MHNNTSTTGSARQDSIGVNIDSQASTSTQSVQQGTSAESADKPRQDGTALLHSAQAINWAHAHADVEVGNNTFPFICGVYKCHMPHYLLS